MNAVTAIAVVLLLVAMSFDLPALIRKGDRRELLIYIGVSVITLLYLVQVVRGDKIFSPIRSLLEIMEKLGLNYELWQSHS